MRQARQREVAVELGVSVPGEMLATRADSRRGAPLHERLRLSDEYKKRVLTTFLTLMNLHESLDRSANRTTTIRQNRELPVV